MYVYTLYFKHRSEKFANMSKHDMLLRTTTSISLHEQTCRFSQGLCVQNYNDNVAAIS